MSTATVIEKLAAIRNTLEELAPTVEALRVDEVDHYDGGVASAQALIAREVGSVTARAKQAHSEAVALAANSARRQ